MPSLRRPCLPAQTMQEIKKLALDPAALDPLIEESAEEAAPDLPVFQERMANVEKYIRQLFLAGDRKQAEIHFPNHDEQIPGAKL